MNLYRVKAGPIAYLMHAPSIQAASQFVKHWPGVTVYRVTYLANFISPEMRELLTAPARAAQLYMAPDFTKQPPR